MTEGKKPRLIGINHVAIEVGDIDAVSGVEKRHLGFVVDDRSRVIELAEAAGARFVEGPFLDFLDPWGNRLEVIEYSNIQFTKAPNVMRGMGLALTKNDKAKKELTDKDMAE
jgi:hypothetical protein